VLVLDVSMGADALLGRLSVRELKGLRGLRIGVETSAVGAVMLDAALQAAGLQLGDVQPVALAFDEHERAFKAGRVDAVVTYEPVKQRLLGAGAQVLFSSRDVPGLVTDVLAVRSPFLSSHRRALAQAVSGHLAARDAFVRAPALHAPAMAPRLGLPPADVPDAFRDLELPDLARNRQLLAAADGLRAKAEQLHGVMLRAGLLEGRFEPGQLIDAGLVGAG
jgi:NitT/TauT family transport system substrate-binding protein